jgi:hypothetical protein
MLMTDVLDKARKATWIDEKGRPLEVNFRPGLAEAEVNTIEGDLGVRLPHDYRELLVRCSGIDGSPIAIDFSGEPFSLEMAEILPHPFPFASDGCGNFWCVDILPTQELQSTVYFVSHDPPTILFQCRGMHTFIEELIKLGQPSTKSLIEEVQDDSLFNVWQDNPGVLSIDQALRGDADLAEFARSLGSPFALIDLRDPVVGMGFSWGRFGSNTTLCRHGDVRVFAYAAPEKKPGILNRLFGR